jgi:hypothetical protein
MRFCFCLIHCRLCTVNCELHSEAKRAGSRRPFFRSIGACQASLRIASSTCSAVGTTGCTSWPSSHSYSPFIIFCTTL